jgi:hypothetical protein
MKKLFLLMGFVLALATANQAAAQQLRFYYYPASNVYYDVSLGQYVYYDNGGWVTVRTLPSNIQLVKTGRTVVYHAGHDIWVDNAAHKTKYKVKKYPQGKAVGYKGTNPNKAVGKAKPKPKGRY